MYMPVHRHVFRILEELERSSTAFDGSVELECGAGRRKRERVWGQLFELMQYRQLGQP